MSNDGVFDWGAFLRVSWWSGRCESIIDEYSSSGSILKYAPYITHLISTSEKM